VTGAAEVLRDHVAAFNAHDTHRLLTGLARDVEWTTGADTVVGHAALADLFDSWLWSLDPRIDVLRVVAAGDEVAAELRESLNVNGVRRHFTIAGFFTVRGDVIARATIYRAGSADLETVG
jgi:uncharacterized protein